MCGKLASITQHLGLYSWTNCLQVFVTDKLILQLFWILILLEIIFFIVNDQWWTWQLHYTACSLQLWQTPYSLILPKIYALKPKVSSPTCTLASEVIPMYKKTPYSTGIGINCKTQDYESKHFSSATSYISSLWRSADFSLLRTLCLHILNIVSNERFSSSFI